MAELHTTRSYTCDLASGPHEATLRTPLMQDDALADRFETVVLHRGVPVSLAGTSARGWLYIAAEQRTILLDGEITSNRAAVTLTAPCYAVPGACSLVIQIMQGDLRHTVLKVNFSIARTGTENVIDPDNVLPTLPELLGQIAAMEQASAASNAAAASALSAAADARQAASELSAVAAPPIVPSVMGRGILTASDSAHRPLAGLSLYGRTGQDGVPTPSAPVPLVNVGADGTIAVMAAGKNLLNYDVWKTLGGIRGSFVYENGGVTITALEDDAYTHDGIGSADTYPARIPVVPGETITLSWEADRSYSAPVYIFPNAGVEGLVSCNNTDNRPLVYTAEEGVTFVTIRFCAVRAGDVISYRNIIVERGVAATAFEPYKDGVSVTALTPNGLPGIPVSSGGHYTDERGQQWICDEVDFGRGVYVQRVKQIVCNGTENWVFADTLDGRNHRYQLHLPDKKFDASNSAPSPILCSAYPAISPDAGYTGADYGIQGQSDAAIIQINDARYPNGNEAGFKAMLAANPITVIYILAEPVETALTADVLNAYGAMRSQYPVTTVCNDAGAGMRLDYVADTKNYIDQRIAALLNV